MVSLVVLGRVDADPAGPDAADKVIGGFRSGDSFGLEWDSDPAGTDTADQVIGGFRSGDSFGLGWDSDPAG